MSQNSHLYSLKEFTHKYFWMNHLNIFTHIYKGKKNGLLKREAIVRRNGSVFIDEDKFIEWILNDTKSLRKTYLYYEAKRKQFNENNVK